MNTKYALAHFAAGLRNCGEMHYCGHYVFLRWGKDTQRHFPLSGGILGEAKGKPR